MARRSPARFLAPLALVAAVVATILVVQSTSSSDGGGGATTTQSNSSGTQSSGTTTTSSTGAQRRVRRFYTVKAGDILSTVSERTGVSVDTLQELNPDIDPQSLQVGQRIRLVPKAASATGDSDITTTTTP